MVRAAVARIVDRHRAHARRERGHHLEEQRRGLLVDVQQRDGGSRARFAVVDVAQLRSHQAALHLDRHALEFIR
jgi:hypothetical protein